MLHHVTTFKGSILITLMWNLSVDIKIFSELNFAKLIFKFAASQFNKTWGRQVMSHTYLTHGIYSKCDRWLNLEGYKI